jgi:hypothetical protein
MRLAALLPVLCALASGQAVAGAPLPRISDNLVQPSYPAKAPVADLDNMERTLIQKVGGEPDLKRHLRAQKGCQAALRVIRSPLLPKAHNRFNIATLFVHANAVEIEYIAYAEQEGEFGDRRARQLYE